MEFIKSVNIIRKQLPYPFYMLLVVVPILMITVLQLALKTWEIEWEWNIYFIGFVGFLIGMNFTFWAKYHYQRLNQFEKAKRVMLIFDVVFLWTGVIILLMP